MDPLYDTAGHPYAAEAWFVGKVRDKEVTHKRLLDRGEVGDFVIRESERGGYTLICKIGDYKLSFPHLHVHSDNTIQMEGSQHRLPSMNHLLKLIKPLAKRPSREIVVDSLEEDTFLLERDDNPGVVDYSFGDRSDNHDGGGYFEVSPVYDISNYVDGAVDYDMGQNTAIDQPDYDMGQNSDTTAVYDVGNSSVSQPEYDMGQNTSLPEYDVGRS
eukprot:m.9801 g.9801  ORF g.9801 m.9801 type:complete len:215 (+) comp4135_c0_seq1:19-663(+)